MGENKGNIAKVIAACVMFVLIAGLSACSSDPTPVPPLPQSTKRATVTVRPSATPVPTLAANPLVITRTQALDESLLKIVSGTYCTQGWRTAVFPASLALPVEPVKGDLLFEWNSSGTNDYISFPGNPTYGLPSSYSIATSADSTDGRDGNWLQVVDVTDNVARTRAHRFPFAGARWVRMTVTSAVPGPLGSTVAIDQVDLHDASRGSDDTVFFMGDSITSTAFTRCPATQPSVAALAHLVDPRRFPAMIDGGVGGVNSGYGVSVIQDWLALNPDFHIWAIGYGTNDAWQKVSPAIFEEQLQTLVDKIKAAGRVPVIARIPFSSKGPADADVRALNLVVDRVTALNGLVPGPDLYAWFKTHTDELRSDGVHPSPQGTRSINRLWYEALRPFYSKSP